MFGDTNTKTFLARMVVLGATIIIAVRVAGARDGVPGGSARTYLTIAGTVTGVAPGATLMQFAFHEHGSVTTCQRDVTVTVSATGSFSAEVPTEDGTSACPGNLFDGRDVEVNVSVNRDLLVANQAINPVPYAIHADHAVTATSASAATPDSGLDQRLASGAGASPPGTVVAFAGSAIPTGWLLCDGRALSSDSSSPYRALFDAIGTTWGTGLGVDSFNLPDLRGRFLRGVDGDAGVDPDRDLRVAIHDGGMTGNNVGTVQDDQFRSHTHELNFNANGPFNTADHFHYIGGGDGHTDSTLPAGGSETRPVNAAVNFIVRF